MKTSFKTEIKNFEVTGVTTQPGLKNNGVDVQDDELVALAFSAQAKGRIVAWNKITGSCLVSVALVASKGFGPKDISFRDFDWVVHIERRGKPVVRAMKPTPRKNTINHALTQLLAPALVGADTHPDRPFIDEKEVAPKVARKRTRKPKAAKPAVTSDLSGLVDNLEAVGLKVLTGVPIGKASDSGSLEMPEFLKR